MNDDLDYWRSRGIRFNPGVQAEPAPEPARRTRPTGHPQMLRIAPWPMPVVLNEPAHDGERLVYESLLWDSPTMAGFAAYSMPLPYNATHRLETDFVAMTPHGLALLEVKGGIVRVNSRPGPGVRWAHETRSGRPTGGHVTPTQLYRLAETFDVTAQAMTGVEFGGRIAQILVFPHTSRGIVDPQLLARLYAPGRDFARIVFAEDLAQHGMWALVADELTRPGRARMFDADEVKRLRGWILGELDVRPGLSEPQEIPALDERRSSLTGFTVAPPRESDAPPVDRPAISPEIPRQRLGFDKPAKALPAAPQFGRWLKRGGLTLAVVTAAIYWAGRPATQPPSVPPPAQPPTAVAAATPPSRPAPTPDPFQSALTRAVAEPDRRIPAGGSDWVRVMGPVTGRAGCQFAEMAYNGQTFNVVACRDGDRGLWRY